MVLRVPESKFYDHFSIEIPPQNPHLETFGTILDPLKVTFSHFALFGEFWSFSGAGSYFFGNVHDFQSHFHLSKCYSFF